MPSKIQEHLNSVGVVVSIFFSFFGFYYENIRASEEVQASVLSFSENTDMNHKLESATVNVLLLNKGNSPVTLADISFKLSSNKRMDRIHMEAINAHDDTLIAPLELLPKHSTKIKAKLKLDESSVHWAKPSATPSEEIYIMMELATVGVNYGLQVIEIKVIAMHIEGWRLTGFSDLLEFKILFPIRNDPPFFKSLWQSLMG